MTNSVFPAVGDTFNYAIDNHPGPQITLGPPGLNQHWDFSSLQRSESWSYTMQPVSTGAAAAQFPDATLVYRLDGRPMIPEFPGSKATEVYLKVTDSQVLLAGFFGGSDPFGANVNDLTQYSRPLPVLKSAPLNFFDVSQYLSVSEVKYPASLFKVPGVTEYRYQVEVQATSVVNGSGTLILPGGTFDVLRVTSDFVINARLDGFLPDFGWIHGEQLGIFPAHFKDGGTVGVRRFAYHEFIDVTSKEVLATVKGPDNDRLQDTDPADKLAVERVQFKDFPLFVCGDFDQDRDVDSADLLGFLAGWTGDGGTGGTRDRGDCDVDGDVDSADMLTFLSNWTGSAASGNVAIVPEPASGALVGVAITGLLLAQHRRQA